MDCNTHIISKAFYRSKKYREYRAGKNNTINNYVGKKGDRTKGDRDM